MKSKRCIRILIFLLVASLLLIPMGCKGQKPAELLDKDNPIIVQLWHYYNGSILNSFDKLVKEFNENLGADLGIIVNSKSFGDVGELENALYDSARKVIGAEKMPDIFATYSDNAYRIASLVNLVPLDKFFTDEELESYRIEFMEDSYLFNDNKAYILPTAKSTENLFLNYTAWKEFAENLGLEIKDLETWEGIQKASKIYYENTGNSFFSIDSIANFMFIFAKQRGIEIIAEGEDGSIYLDFPEELAWEIWNNLYHPYLNGYYAKIGRFGSDDVKTGKIIGFVGSIAGAGYFPKSLTREDGYSEEIESLVLPYPYVEGDKLYVINQGAGMSLVSSDEAHEYAASIFLKWFTDIDQNIKFALESTYLPVKSESYTSLSSRLQEINIPHDTSKKSLETSLKMLSNYKFYNNKPGPNIFHIRRLMDSHLYTKLQEDLRLLESRIYQGESRESIIDEMIDKKEFKKWYKDFLKQMEMVI